MKNSKRTRFSAKIKKSIKLVTIMSCIAIVFACTLSFSTAGYFNIDHGDTPVANAVISNDIYEQALDPAYETLAHGSTYTFTDKNKVDGYRKGTEPSDTTTVTVDRRKQHGSKENPFVINSIDGNSNGRGSWNKFASTVNAGNSSGKYFVIANDLDWTGKSFSKVSTFSGILCGGGNTLKNFTINCSSSMREAGIFDSATNAVIADLSVVNYTYNNMSRGAGLVVNADGVSALNCHTQGKMLGTNTGPINTYDGSTNVGGFFVAAEGVYVYRSSAGLVVNASCPTNHGNGSLYGGVYASCSGNFTVLDSYFDIDITIHNPMGGVYGNIFGGNSNNGAANAEKIAENVIGRVVTHDTNVDDRNAAFLSGWVNTSGNPPLQSGTLNFKNIYVDASTYLTSSPTVQTNVNPTMYTASANPGADHNLAIKNRYSITTSNLHYVNSYNKLNYSTSANNGNMFDVSGGLVPESASDLWANAKAAATNIFKSDIWKQDTTIGSTYDVANNPVINKDVTSTSRKASFYNLKNGSETLITSFTYSSSSVFPTIPTSFTPDTNHTLAGWTADLNEYDDENIYKANDTFSSDIRGDIKFYAVWDVATVNDTLTSSVTTKDGTVAGDTVEYLKDKNSIKIESNITATGMTNPTITYAWKLESTKLGTTTGCLTLKDVNQSGKYTLEYFIQSPTEKLWRHKGTTDITVTITPGKLTPKSMTVDKTAYYGMTLNELVPSAVMQDADGNTVTGTTSWTVNLNKVEKINDTDPDYQEGKAYAEFFFEPSSSYNGNYQYLDSNKNKIKYNTSTTPVTDLVYFDAEDLVVKFATASSFGSDLTYNVSLYGDNISYQKIATEFEALFADFCTKNPTVASAVEGKTPQLKLNTDSKFYSISEYKTKSGGYSSVKQSITIDVKFEDITYTVTYKYNDGGATPDKVESGKTYGQKLIKPTPDPTYGSNTFLGWFYPEMDENGNPVYENGTNNPKMKRWDFDVDSVESDLILTARWLAADSLNHIEIVAKKPSYNALEPLGAGDLTVTAYYNAKDANGDPTVIPIELAWEDYKDKITYVGNAPGDSVLHVGTNGAKTKISIKYEYFHNGTTTDDTKTIELVVNPVKIDISDLTVSDKNVLYDGTAKSIDSLDIAKVQHLTDPNSRKIINIDYTYYLGGTEVQPDDVTAIGDYTVIISFTTNDPDFVVDPITVKLSIVSELPPENPENPGEDNPNPPTPGNDNKSIADKIREFFENLIANNFPLWQIATIAVGGLLSIIFLIKSIQYGNRRKKAKGEAKRYGTKTLSALLPVFATDVVLAGLTNQVWSIIAFSVVGVTVLMFLIAIILRKRWKKADLAKEEAMTAIGINPQTGNQLVPVNNGDTVALLAEMRREMQETLTNVRNETQPDGQSDLERRLIEMEERRREEEERHRKELEALREEQAKRDEAMKIMLANMMGRQQGADGVDMSYASVDDTDLLVQKVIAGLLPMVQQMVPEPTAYLSAPDGQDDRYGSLVSKIDELQNKLDYMSQNRVDAELLPDNSEELRALAEAHQKELDAVNDKMQAMSDEHFAEMQAMRSQLEALSSISVDELDDEDFDDEEEWDSILDEDDDDFVEAVIIEEDGKQRKVYPNFRMRLKQSSDKNREWYTAIKNLFCSQKGVTYRVCKRVEKIRYQGQVIAVIGIAKRSIKLWLALKPYEYDARRYHHKDVSDKPRFVDVPMYVRVTSDRTLFRTQELILALFQDFNMEARKRYNDRDIQELIFTLKHNKLMINKQYKRALCQIIHVQDCNILDDETAEKCIEYKNIDIIDDSVIETVKLDDIDAKFQDGNRITLEKLRKVGLVSEDCTGYTVIADKRLTKPFIIVANDFTLEAVKMIVLTGGRVIKLSQI